MQGIISNFILLILEWNVFMRFTLYELIRKMCPQWKTLVMILPRTFMCVCVCVWVYSMSHVSQYVQLSQFARGIVLLPISPSLSWGGLSPALTAVPHIAPCPSLQLQRGSMMPPDRWDTPGASTAQASTNPRCGTDRWCSRPPSLQCQLGWSSFQRSNLDLSHGEKEEILRKQEWARARRSLFWGGMPGWLTGVLKAEQTCGCFSQPCTDGLVFVTLKLFCSSLLLSL